MCCNTSKIEKWVSVAVVNWFREEDSDCDTVTHNSIGKYW